MNFIRLSQLFGLAVGIFAILMGGFQLIVSDRAGSNDFEVSLNLDAREGQADSSPFSPLEDGSFPGSFPVTPASPNEFVQGGTGVKLEIAPYNGWGPSDRD